jgi:predicted nucleic acid-binding protein
MLVVSNTSPITNLASVGVLDLLRQQFGEVVIPSAVINELKLETDYPGTGEIRAAIKAGWLKQINLEDDKVARALQRELDDGEAEAIAPALQLKIETILMDERDGRSVAKSMGLVPIGVIGVLVRAKQNGNIHSIKDMLNKLKDEAGFYITDSLMKNILFEIGES